MTIQYDNLNTIISAVGSDTNIPINIQPKGTGGLNLLGSGSNLLTYSASLPTGWAQQNITVTTGQADPFGGTTAVSLNSGTTASVFHYFTSSFTTGVQNTNYTVSVYAKAGTANFIGVGCYVAGLGVFYGQVFNLTTGASTGLASFFTAPISYSSVDVGNGWWRFSVVFNSTTVSGSGLSAQHFMSENGTVLLFTGTSKTILFAGPQLEFGSVANTYVPTTTATIYGTPTLTLSGVAGVGLQSDGSLYVQPAGTSALQAAPTTSTAVGGNARGQYAVDWQTSRSSAGSVASGQYSFVGGGNANSATSAGCISMGLGNGATGFGAATLSGNNNSCSNVYAVVTGGQSNACSSYLGMIGGGKTNTAAGAFNFIGGGFTNSGTSGSAVTTQSGTMNATTAVTLSGSNANIKVGQYITGTSIGDDTYVTAISGTSLTLSKAATGSSTSVLSFYTPHGVVVGGGNNQATGSYSFIGGGGDAGTAANRNVASGAWSSVLGGFKNTASNIGAVVCGGGTYDGANGGGNTSSGLASFVAAGWGNTANNDASVCLGVGNLANSRFSTAVGIYSNTRSIIGNFVVSPCNAPLNALYTNQIAFLVLARQTTDATATVLTCDTSAAGTTNQVILPNNSAYFFTGEVVSGVTGGGNTKGWTIEGVIKRGANAASTALVGTPTVTSMYADVGAATWTIAVTADTTNGGLAVTFTGQAGTTIRTVAQIRTTEMTY